MSNALIERKFDRIETASKERWNAPRGLTRNRTELDRRAAMQSTQITPADFLAARTARGVSIKTAARDIGIAFSNIIRWNRGVVIGPRSLEKIAAWIDQTPIELEEPQEWRAVVGYEGYYEVSDLGNVRSVERTVEHARSGAVTIRARDLRKNPHGSGHLMVCLSRGRKQSTRYVHRLVLEAFVGPQPEDMEACHWDGEPSNNRLSNLRWDTRSGNRDDARRHGTLTWPGKDREPEPIGSAMSCDDVPENTKGDPDV